MDNARKMLKEIHETFQQVDLKINFAKNSILINLIHSEYNYLGHEIRISSFVNPGDILKSSFPYFLNEKSSISVSRLFTYGSENLILTKRLLNKNKRLRFDSYCHDYSFWPNIQRAVLRRRRTHQTWYPFTFSVF